MNFLSITLIIVGVVNIICGLSMATDGISEDKTVGIVFFIIGLAIVLVGTYLKKKRKAEVIKEEKVNAEETIDKINKGLIETYDNGIFPFIEKQWLEKDEKCFWAYGTQIKKNVKVRVGGGSFLTFSTKPILGVRYRSYTPISSSYSTQTVVDDSGELYLTTKRILYIGNKRTVELKLKDIIDIELTPDKDNVGELIIKRKTGLVKTFYINACYTFGTVMSLIEKEKESN